MEARKIRIGLIVIFSLLMWALISTTKYQAEIIKRSKVEKALLTNKSQIDSLKGVNAERQAQIDELSKQLKINENDYKENIKAIDSLNNLNLRKAMQRLLAELTKWYYNMFKCCWGKSFIKAKSRARLFEQSTKSHGKGWQFKN